MNCRVLRLACRRSLLFTSSLTNVAPYAHIYRSQRAARPITFWEGLQRRNCGSKAKEEAGNTDSADELTFDEELKQLNFYQRYKKLLKEYWYVLIPVHCCTSCFWFGSCLAIVYTGVEVDLVYIAESLHLPEGLVRPLRNPNLGKMAIALMLYKLVSPLRYMSTVYAAIPSIKYLVRKKLIKPVPRLTSKTKIEEEISRIKHKITKKRGED